LKEEEAMAVQVPTEEQLREVAADVGLSLTDADVKSYIDLMRGSVAAYNVVDAMPDNLPRVKYPRTPGYRPTGDENKHNAWYVKTKVEGAARGKLKGKTFRISNMGDETDETIAALLKAFDAALAETPKATAETK